MLLQKYLKTIGDLDPRKIYVENVRHTLKVPTFFARLICEMGVVDHVLIRKIGVVCPNCKRIIASYKNVDEIPEEITCDTCEDYGDIEEEHTFQTSDLEIIEFYQINYDK